MSEGKGVKQKWGGKLVELFTPKKPEQSPEQYAEALAGDVAEKIVFDHLLEGPLAAEELFPRLLERKAGHRERQRM